MTGAPSALGPQPQARILTVTLNPALDLATSLNQMNERTMLAALVAEEPSVPQDRVVDTLAHIWVTSIYGQQPESLAQN